MSKQRLDILLVSRNLVESRELAQRLIIAGEVSVGGHPCLVPVFKGNVSSYKDTCIHIFIAALFTIAKPWNQPKFPSIIDWIKKMWYMYTMEYYAVMKRNEIMSFAGTWMKLEAIILAESKLTLEQKTKNHMFSLISES